MACELCGEAEAEKAVTVKDERIEVCEECYQTIKRRELDELTRIDN